MDKKSIIAAIVGAAIAGVVGLIVTNIGKDIEAGSDALTANQIRTVMREENVAIINGETMTYGEALNSIATEQAVQRATLEALVE